jgi:hypothetical protein
MVTKSVEAVDVGDGSRDGRAGSLRGELSVVGFSDLRDDCLAEVVCGSEVVR